MLKVPFFFFFLLFVCSEFLLLPNEGSKLLHTTQLCFKWHLSYGEYERCHLKQSCVGGQGCCIVNTFLPHHV